MQTKYEQRLDVSLSHMGMLICRRQAPDTIYRRRCAEQMGVPKTMILFKYYNYFLPQYKKTTVVNINQNQINLPSVCCKADDHLPRKITSHSDLVKLLTNRTYIYAHGCNHSIQVNGAKFTL